MGNTLLAASSSKGGSPFTLIIILVLIFGIFYFLMIRPQRNRQRQVVQTQDAVVPGQRVRTTAGMYGTVTAVEDGDVVIEVAPGVEVRYLKRAIMEVLSDAPYDGAPYDGADEGTGNGAHPAAEAEPAAGESVDERPAPRPADAPAAAPDAHLPQD